MKKNYFRKAVFTNALLTQISLHPLPLSVEFSTTPLRFYFYHSCFNCPVGGKTFPLPRYTHTYSRLLCVQRRKRQKAEKLGCYHRLKDGYQFWWQMMPLYYNFQWNFNVSTLPPPSCYVPSSLRTTFLLLCLSFMLPVHLRTNGAASRAQVGNHLSLFHASIQPNF